MRNRSSLIIAGMSLAVVILSGCGGSGSSSSTPVSPIIGTFHQTSISGNAQSATCPGMISLADGTTDICGASDSLQFKTDGTFAGVTQGKALSGTYTLTNTTLTLNITAPAAVAGKTISGMIAFSNNNATLALLPMSATDSTDYYTRE